MSYKSVQEKYEDTARSYPGQRQNPDVKLFSERVAEIAKRYAKEVKK